MADPGQIISFQLIAGQKGGAEAEQRLRSAGFEQIARTPDEGRLHVVASRELIERVFGFSLQERRRPGRVGSGQREIVDLVLPEGAELPANLADVVESIVFPVTPDYSQSPRRGGGL